MTGDLVQEVAAMASAMGKVPPRSEWVNEHQESSDAWEGFATL